MQTFRFIAVAALLLGGLLFAQDATQDNFAPDNRWFLKNVNVPNNLRPGLTQKPLVIAVVDDGVRITHQDLKDFIWKNPKEIPNNNIDDDGNGFIDDIHGWDISDNDNQPTPPKDRLKDFYHGTHLAGIVTQIARSAYGKSASDHIKIMPVKCLADHASHTYIKDGYKGIDYALKANADIIICAWGVGHISPHESSILQKANAKGITIAASAGNFPENLAHYPAADENVIAVAALDRHNNKIERSNYGAFVDIAAPGEKIHSTGSLSDSAHETKDGTSPATAIVAAAAAIIKLQHPSYSPRMITACLKSSADPIKTTDPEYTAKLGAGKLNIKAALQTTLFEQHTPEDSMLTRPHGYLRFHNPTAKFASWRIRPPGQFKGLRFKPMITKGSTDQTTISFYTHDAPDAQLITSYPLANLTESVYVPGVSAYVTIETKKANPNLEFVLAYKAEPINFSTLYCSDTEYLTEEGSFTDGSGPNDYSPRSNCKWLITAPEGKVIDIEFNEFHTQAKTDFLYFFDGEGTHEKIMAIFSGPDIPPELITWRNKVLVWFVTDNKNQAPGFKANYSFVDPPRFILTQ